MQVHFTESSIAETAQAIAFGEKFNCTLTKIKQGPGVTGDYIVSSGNMKGKTIEFKDDISGLTTGNFYIEFEQTSDQWFTRKKSGHVLAIERGNLLVISVGKEDFLFDKDSYARFIQGDWKVRTTRKGRNGNANGVFTRGWLIPIKRGRERCTLSYMTA